MKTSIKWESKINETDYFIEYTGMNFLGKVSLTLNGETHKYYATRKGKDGYWLVFNCGKNECLLNISIDKKSAEVYVDGKPLSETPEIITATEESQESTNPFMSVEYNRKVNNGMSSFLSILVLSIVNIFLIMFEAPISFPFSLFGTTMVIGTGFAVNQEITGIFVMVIAISIAVVMIAFYALLYFLSGRSTIAVWISFVFLVLDTVGLVGFAIMSQDIASFLVDIAFHAWILWSILQLGLAKGKLTKTTLGKVDIHTRNIQESKPEFIEMPKLESINE